MPVSVTRVQTRSVQPPATSTGAPIFRVVDECTAASVLTRYIYVLSTDDMSFSRVATPADMALYGTDRAQAQTDRKAYYRVTAVTRDFSSLTDAKAFADAVPALVQYLCNQYQPLVDGFVGSTEETTIARDT